ncbi:MAG: xanthine dehydrogenase accessory factor [Bacteroidia bacterium]|nr:MAG: xanthine dehydrogenase accessory factor [Bacteroidia bacterium]
MSNVLLEISQLLRIYSSVALCTIVETTGSTPMKSGSKIIVCPDGKVIGTIGGGALEKSVIENAITCISSNESKLFIHHLTKEHQMCCGGTVKVFIDIVLSPYKLYIFGAGHVGSALAKIASFHNDLKVFLIDDRPDYIQRIQSQSEYLERINCVLASPVEFVRNLDPNSTLNSFCVIVTYDHQLDREILLNALSRNFRYVGMIGSKRKVLVTKKFLIQHHISEDKISTIDMPIGININAYYPEEIAVSIMAKIISLKNEKIVDKRKNNQSLSDELIKETENIDLCLKNLS